jgi:hypothetical protein
MYDLNQHAQLELKLANLLEEEESKLILDLIKLFSESSLDPKRSAFVSDLFWKLANGKNLTPVEQNEEEWLDRDGIRLNKRNSDLIKYPDGKIEYTKALVFQDRRGNTWTGSCWLNKDDCESGDNTKKINSSQEVIKFPFMPKSFYIDVIEFEINDEIHTLIKDINQLKAAISHYPLIWRNLFLKSTQ